MPAHAAPTPKRRRTTLVLSGLFVVLALAAVVVLQTTNSPADQHHAAAIDTGSPTTAADEETTTSTATTLLGASSESGYSMPGLLTFRGSATRTYYGEGPVPQQPTVQWSYPPGGGGMCAESSVGDETKTWCGSGWTGEPAVFERDGRTWVVFGAYDRAVHFVDYDTGEDILPPFPTGDIIKGSVTIDPDGFPLVYSGSRDNEYHVIAIDRPEPTELWALHAHDVSPTLWNDDWDGSGLVIDDYLYEGGENSQFHVVKLNRSMGDDGLVHVDPQLVFHTPGWDNELLANLPDHDVSIENSVAIHDGVVYFANSGGLVQGWDVSGLAAGVEPTRVFRYWTGDDTDASVVIDAEGFLYVASEYERFNARAAEVGQLVKLDPRRPDDPIVWSVQDTGHRPGGFWATPALHEGVVIVPDDAGDVRGWDMQTGEQLWEFHLPGPTWQSTVIVDDVMIQGDCDGVLHGYDVSDPRVQPPELWSIEIGGCIESTPAVWHGRIFFGTRAGRFWALGDS